MKNKSLREDAVMCLDCSYAYHLWTINTSDYKSAIWLKIATFLLCDVCFPLEIVARRQFDRMKYASVCVLYLFKQFAGD